MSKLFFSTYILDGHTPVLCTDDVKWLAWWGSHDRTIAKTDVGKMWVSTIFLGLDHNYFGKGPPVLFETMVFERGSYRDLWCDRGSSWEEALLMHQDGIMFAKRRQRLPLPKALS